MMTEDQNNRVIEYLIWREVSFDLLPEVHDHFVTQINKYIKEGKDFEAAFNLTDITWEKELKKVHLNYFTLYKAPNIVAKMNRIENLRIIKDSMLYAVPILLPLIISTFLLSKEVFKYEIMGVLILFLILLSYYQIKYYKKFRLRDKLVKRDMNFSVFRFPEIGFMMLTQIPNFLMFFKDENYIDFSIFSNKIHFVLFIIWLFVIITSGIYLFLVYKKMLKSIDKMQPYLKIVLK